MVFRFSRNRRLTTCALRWHRVKCLVTRNLWDTYWGQIIKTCLSSSIAFIGHCAHVLSAIGVFGVVYLPYSISNLWELVLNRAIFLRSKSFDTCVKYFSNMKNTIHINCNSKRNYVSEFAYLFGKYPGTQCIRGCMMLQLHTIHPENAEKEQGLIWCKSGSTYTIAYYYNQSCSVPNDPVSQW